MTININIHAMSLDLIKVKSILEETDSMATAEVCHLYIDLCKRFADGIEPDSTALIMNRLKEEYYDNQDIDACHSIAGHMNDPSDTQKQAFDKDDGS